MATTNIGQVSIVPMGAFNLGTAYKRLSVVTYNGSSYIAKVDNTNKPITDTTVWYLLASKGDKGDTYEVTPEDLQEIADEITSDASSAFNQNVAEKTEAFDTHVISKTSDFDTNATNKTTTFNNNASTKTTDFNTNSTNKTTDFNTNATNKTNDFNSNATSKTTDFNTNASDKTTAFNTNAQAKVDYYNQNADELIAFNEELLDQIPTANVEGTIINVTDSSNLPLADIKLKGNTYQLQTTGKNLADITQWEAGAYDTSTGGAITSSFTARSTQKISVEANTTYTISVDESVYAIRIYEYQSDDTFIQIEVTNNGSTLTFTTTANTSYVYWTIDYNHSYNPALYILKDLELQLELGSVRTSYEQYSSGVAVPNPGSAQSINVVTGDITTKIVGKNMFSTSASSTKINGTVNVSTSGNDVTLTNPSSSQNRGIIYWIPVGIGQNITLSYSAKTMLVGETMRLLYIETNNPLSEQLAGANRGIEVNTTTLNSSWTTSKKYVGVYIRLGNSCSGTFSNLQLELGSTATTYEPYTEQSQLLSLGTMELAKIGDYEDYIYYDKTAEKWYKCEAIYKKTLDGMEDWSAYSRNGDSALAYVGVYAPSNALPTKSYNVDTKPLVASNKFKRTIYTEVYERTIVNGIARYTGGSSNEANQNIFIAVDRNSLASYNLTGFKAWLSTNTPVIYYVVETPTITEITDTTLIGQLNNLLLMKTCKNITNIFTIVAEGNETPSLQVVYRKDLETLFNQLAVLDARVTLLEE